MTTTLADASVIADAAVRSELLEFVRHASAHVVNTGRMPEPTSSLRGERAPLWHEQVTLDEAVALIRSPDSSG